MAYENKKNRLVSIGVILWVSFLWAAIATMLFFATFDPQEISKVATFPMNLDRSSGYSFGFLLFWALLVTNSSIVIWLANRKPG